MRMAFLPAAPSSQSARMAQPRIGQNGENVGGHVQENERGGENQATSLNDRHVVLGDLVDHQLAKARIYKYGLDDHDSDDQIGQIQRDDGNDGRQGVRQ